MPGLHQQIEQLDERLAVALCSPLALGQADHAANAGYRALPFVILVAAD